MRDLLIRCSSIGYLMTEPRNKSEVLSVGAKTHIREVAAQDIFGVEFEISDKKIEKGNLVEDDSIELLNEVRGLTLDKNKERRSNEWITGECDLFDGITGEGYDIKSAWSLATFPLCVEDVAEAQRKLYDYQMRGYMWLWNAPRWHVAYCMVSTPDHLCRYEPNALHAVGRIPAHHRVTLWTVERDMGIEKAIADKVRHARAYYLDVVREFDRTHQPLALAA